MAFVMQMKIEGARLAGHFRETLRALPWLSVAIGCYWAMIVLSLYSPYLLGILGVKGFPLSAGAVSTTASIVAYVAISFRFRTYTKLDMQSWFFPVLGVFMTVGSLSYVLSLSGVLSGDFSVFLFIAGLAVVGITTVGVCFALARIFAAIGPRRVLFHGSIALLGGSVAVFFISLLPHVVAGVALVFLPVALASSLSKSFAALQISRRSHTEKSGVHVPWKFLATSGLQGFALGVMHCALLDAPPALAQLSTLGFCAAAVLLMLTSIIAMQDFNTLFYRVSFPMMALGFFVVWLGAGQSGALLVGGVVLDAGYCYQYLVSCCLCAYLARNFEQSPIWIVGISTACLLIGQCAGGFIGGVLGDISLSSSVCVFVLLLSSLYLTSDKNLKRGWGSFRPGECIEDAKSAAQSACELIAGESGLSKRETEVMSMIAVGATRKEIAQTLVLSEETVKSHAANLYQKLGVHSKKELASLVETRASLFE